MKTKRRSFLRRLLGRRGKAAPRGNPAPQARPAEVAREADTLRSSVQKAMEEVRKRAESITADARRQAELEAGRIIARAKQEAQAIKSEASAQANEAASQEAEALLRTARARVTMLEAGASEKAQRMAEEARDNLARSVQTVMEQVQREAEKIRADARSGAEVEAAGTVATARQEAQALRAETLAGAAEAASRQADAILEEGRAQAKMIEVDAAKKARSILAEAQAASRRAVQQALEGIQGETEEIRAVAVREAEAQAAQVLATARREAQALQAESVARARDTAAREAEAILRNGRARAEMVEAEAAVKAQSIVAEARDRVEAEIRDGAMAVSRWLHPMLQDLIAQAQKAQADWSRHYEEHRQESAHEGEAAEQSKTIPYTFLQEEASALRGLPAVKVSQQQEESEEGEQPAGEVAQIETREESVQPVAEGAPSLAGLTPTGSRDVPRAQEEVAVGEQPKFEGRPSTVAEDPVAEAASRSRVDALETAKKTVYSGEVNLVLLPPVDATTVARLYGQLTGNTEVRILSAVGSWEMGTTITLLLERPLPLVAILSQIPAIRIDPSGGSRRGSVPRGSAGRNDHGAVSIDISQDE